MLRYRNGLLLFIIITILSLVGCNKQGSLNVSLGGKVKETEDKIIVAGKSNLLSGSRVNGVILVDDDEVFSETTELVDNKGKFNMELDHHQYGDAEVVISFDFQNSVQDEEIIEHYGEGGQNIEGPYTYLDEHWDSSDPQAYKKAEVRLSLNAADDETTYEFVQPEWEKRPKDYGDPRVWIEVDDITNDDEFFYMTGRSNLLEGTLIEAYYSSSFQNDETRVNPDGTFEFKIEYEGKPFVINFYPSGQWSTIQENYGSDGEKLVGNLVEKSGSMQYIELTVDIIKINEKPFTC